MRAASRLGVGEEGDEGRRRRRRKRSRGSRRKGRRIAEEMPRRRGSRREDRAEVELVIASIGAPPSGNERAALKARVAVLLREWEETRRSDENSGVWERRGCCQCQTRADTR